MKNAIEILERLVGFPSVSARSNLDLIQWIRDELARHGIKSDLVPAPDGQPKANLWASIGPDAPGGLVLSGHTDVVPVEGQPWSSDPFTLSQRDGRLYGRGTSDMKGFIALCLALVPEMLARPLKVPIHFAFSYDEEIGCLGAPHLIAELGKRFPKPALAIIGEPTELKLGTRHKGCYSFETEITGRDAHSSQTHKGANAILAAAAIVGELDRIAEELTHSSFNDANFEPPYPTINVGRIDGGTAVNIVARHCAVHWDFRATPGADPSLVLPQLERFIADTVLPRLQRVAPEAQRDDAAARAGAAPGGRARRRRGDSGQVPDRRQPDHRRRLRNRGGTVPGGGLVRHRLRTGFDPAGASAGRVHRAQPDAGRRGSSCAS